VTAEALVEVAPDVIIVPAEGVEMIGGVEAFLALPGVGQTPAGERGAILAYPEGDFLTFGPRIADSLRLLIEDLAGLPD
jgi:iron complex transport system substrate-binding protein